MRIALRGCVLALAALWMAPAVQAQSARPVDVVGTVLDETNAITLPGVPVEVTSTGEVVYTDLDGVFALSLAPGQYELKVVMDGYAEQLIRLDVRASQPVRLNVSLPPTRFTEEVTVVGQAVEAESSSAEAQLVERRRAPVISDNVGSQELKQNADSDAAAGLQRVTGLSVVDGQYVFVRGLGERYSTTTLNGAVLPTTEPNRRVLPLDILPSGLIDSVKITKSYQPDKPAEFAGGLVEITPLKFPRSATLDFSLSGAWNSLTTGDDVLDYPGGNRDWLGFDDGTRDLPAGFRTGA